MCMLCGLWWRLDATLLEVGLRPARSRKAVGFTLANRTCSSISRSRADTSALVEDRWDIEVNSRLKAEMNCATVWAIGINDSAHEKSANLDGQRVPLDQSLERISRMIMAAKSVGPALWVGPTHSSRYLLLI